MKKLVVLLSIMFIATTISAQEIEREVVASAGTTSASEGYTISWTLGEVAVSTLTAEGYTLSQGFHQGAYAVTAIDDLLPENYEMNVYPNPSPDYVTFSYDFPEEERIILRLYSLDGKLLQEQELNPEAKKVQVDLQAYSASTYILKVISVQGKSLGSFKLIRQ